MAGIGHNGAPVEPESLLRTAQVYARLQDAIDAAGGQKAWAEANGMTPQHLNDVLMARRDISEIVLASLGLRRVVRYSESGIMRRPLLRAP